MATTYTPNPSAALPGQVVGAPVAHLPWIFLCESPGEGKHCGWARCANTLREIPEVMKAKRLHEQTCKGGLIVASAG